MSQVGFYHCSASAFHVRGTQAHDHITLLLVFIVVQVIGAYRIQMAHERQRNLGVWRHNHDIVTVAIYDLPDRSQSMLFQITMEKIENLPLLSGGAIDIDESPQQLLQALGLDDGS